MTSARSLLRTEAEERAALLRVHTVLVELDLTGPGAEFASRTTISFDCATPGAATFVDFKGERLCSARLNGQSLDLTTWDRERLPLPDLATSNTLTLEGQMAYSTDGEGLHRHVDPADGQTYLYAMSFLDAAPRWFACFDQPDLKARFAFTVRVRADWTVLGNGPAKLVAPGHWQVNADRPLSTYMVTLVAGPYASVYDEHDGIRLGFHARASLAEFLRAETPDLAGVTKGSLDYFHRMFQVRYPFAEYHQAFVPDFNAGAMENPGCVTFRDQLIFRAKATTAERATRAGTIAHEMAHMWFGNLVTLHWWDDLWLNESFAEYMAQRCCSEVTPYALWTEFGIVRKDWGAVADQSPATHPVAGTGALDAHAALQDFDGISYAKGAAVLKQLAAYLSDEVFLAGLGDYFNRHAFGNARFADLIGAWSRAGAVDLDRWAASWLRSTGMDTIDVRCTAGGVVLTSTPPPAQPVPRRHAIRVDAFNDAGQRLDSARVVINTDPLPLPVPAGSHLVVPDAGDDTWAKIRFGPHGWRRAAGLLTQLADPPTRVVICNAIRDGVRDAEVSPADALTMIIDGLASEQSEVVLGSMLSFAEQQLAGPYCWPSDRPERLAVVHRTASQMVATAPPGSDRQLVAFRSAVRTSTDTQRLAGWLRSVGLPAGLDLDPELSWAIVQRLAVLTGDAGLIANQVRADPSSASRVHAARARASLPDSAAKEAAWRVLMEPSERSAYEVYATAEGFFQPSQTDLTAGYVRRYFHDIVGTAAFRSGWALGQVALLAYPADAATAATVVLAEQALARPDLSSALRRSLLAGTDRLRRAVAALERFG